MNENLTNNVNDYRNQINTQANVNTAPLGANVNLQPKKVNPFTKVEFTKKDLIGLAVSAVLLFFVSYLGIINFFNFGFTVTMGVFTVFTYFYLYKKQGKSKGFNAFSLISALLLISSFSLNNDGVIKFVSVLYLVFLLVISFSGVSDNNKNSDTNYNWFFGAFIKPVFSAFSNILSPFMSAKNSIKNGKGKNVSSVLIGVLVAVPVLFVIVPLLSSSDIAFEAVVSKIFTNTSLIILALVITAILLPVFYSLIFYLEKSSLVEVESKKKNLGKISVVGINSFLISISFVYLFYLFTQLAYIVDAFAFVLPEDYTAAEFARSGFFQMAVIVFINFVILGVTAIKVKRENAKLPCSTKAILLFISSFTIFYISTAIIKMAKYISLYGLTRLRVLTSAFMIMLAIIFVVIILKLLIAKFKYVKPIIVVCTLTLLSVSMININTVIAEYNYNAYKAGKIDIDVEQIESLGVSGIPVLAKLVDEENYEISFKAKEALYYSASDIYFDAFSSNPEDTVLAKDTIFEYNKAWLEAKKTLDEFKLNHPQFNKATFNAESNKYYGIDGDVDSDAYGWY